MAGKQPGDTVVQVDGHRLTLTNLDKVLYPQTGTTKAEVLQYYALVAPALLPVLAGRPVTRKRWPNGVGTGGNAEPFFVKNVESGAPSWIPRQTIAHTEGDVTYPLVDSAAVLTWMAQMAALELHVPQWRFAHSSGGGRLPGRPDRMVFDLDPGPGAGLAECAEVALMVREVLQQAGSDAVPVTSGSKGLHLYVPLDGARTSDEVSSVAKAVAESLQASHPKLVTSKMAKSARGGRVFVDWSQNSAAKTTIAPYSLRGRDSPAVAAPRDWSEIEPATLQHLLFSEVLDRLDDGVDPWAELFDGESDGGPVDGDSGNDDTGVDDSGHDDSGHDDSGADVRAAAAAYAIAALRSGPASDTGKHEKHVKYGSHQWQDPLEGPRGRVVRREFTRTPGRTASPQVSAETVPAPMLATAGTAADIVGDRWRFEAKWDGIRAVAQIVGADDGAASGGSVRLIGRSGRDLTGGYPELAELAEVVGEHRVVLDGEIVALDGDGRTSFPLLQQRMNVARPSARLLAAVPVRYFVFDVLSVDGLSVVGKPYDDRRKILTALSLTGDVVDVPRPIDGELDDALRFTREHGWEGVVAKRGDSVYRPGVRGGLWVKIKHQRTQEVVIIGWRRGAGRRSGGIGSLLMAVSGDDGSLVYCGRVGTGFTDTVLAELRVTLGEPIDRPACVVPPADAKDAVWVEPLHVGEVSFVEWTPDGRLRAPSWRGLRPDKDPSDAHRE